METKTFKELKVGRKYCALYPDSHREGALRMLNQASVCVRKDKDKALFQNGKLYEKDETDVVFVECTKDNILLLLSYFDFCKHFNSYRIQLSGNFNTEMPTIKEFNMNHKEKIDKVNELRDQMIKQLNSL